MEFFFVGATLNNPEQALFDAFLGWPFCTFFVVYIVVCKFNFAWFCIFCKNVFVDFYSICSLVPNQFPTQHLKRRMTIPTINILFFCLWIKWRLARVEWRVQINGLVPTPIFFMESNFSQYAIMVPLLMYTPSMLILLYMKSNICYNYWINLIANCIIFNIDAKVRENHSKSLLRMLCSTPCQHLHAKINTKTRLY